MLIRFRLCSAEKFKEMVVIKLIPEVDKHRELYDPHHQFYKDNVKKYQCWDAVRAAVRISRFLNIVYAMFMYHVSVKCEKRHLRGGEMLADPRREMCFWCEQPRAIRS